MLQSAPALLLHICHLAAPSPLWRLALFLFYFRLLCDSDWQADVVGAAGIVNDDSVDSLAWLCLPQTAGMSPE